MLSSHLTSRWFDRLRLVQEAGVAAKNLERFGSRVKIVQGNFANIDEIENLIDLSNLNDSGIDDRGLEDPWH